MTPLLQKLLLGGGAGTHPALIPGCFMCFDAWRPDKMGLTGGNQVSSWTDLISGTAFVQGVGASRPLFDGSFVTADGSDDSLRYTAGAIAGYPTSGSFDFVGLINNPLAGATVNNGTFFSYPNTGANGLTLTRGNSGNVNRINSVVGDGSGTSSVGSLFGDAAGKCIIRVSIVSGGPFNAYYVNDILTARTSTLVPLFSGATRYSLFGNAASSIGALLTGGIHMLAGFPRILTDGEWRSANAYLKARKRAV